MNIEEIGEPIRVMADFHGGGAVPLRFRWSNRTYVVSQVNGKWVDRADDGCRLHYSVQVGSETYYIHFCCTEVQWWLDQVMLQG